MADDANPRARAIGALAEMFAETAFSADGFASLERSVTDVGHECPADAFALALEALDAKPLAERAPSPKVHDVRPRTLATEIGGAAGPPWLASQADGRHGGHAQGRHALRRGRRAGRELSLR